MPPLAAPDPSAAHIGGTAEVFAQDLRLRLRNCLNVRSTKSIGLSTLHRVFVEFVSIRLERPGWGGFSSTPGVLFIPRSGPLLFER